MHRLRCHALAVAASVLAAAPPAWAGAEPAAEAHADEEGADTPPEDPTLAEAERVYREGLSHYETADYGKAIEAWTTAYGILPNTRGYLRIRLLLLYNLATAHQRAYEIDHDARHLRQSKVLLENFRTSIPNLYDLSDPTDRARAEREKAKVEARLAEIDALLARDESAEEGPPPVEPVPPPAPKPSRPMFAAGGVVLGLGVAGLSVMGVGLAVGARANDLSGLDPQDLEGRRAQFDRGRAGNVMAIVGGSVGGVATVIGAVLLGVGGARRAEEKRAADDLPTVRVAPLWRRHGAGVRVAVRF